MIIIVHYPKNGTFNYLFLSDPDDSIRKIKSMIPLLCVLTVSLVLMCGLSLVWTHTSAYAVAFLAVVVKVTGNFGLFVGIQKM